MVCFGCFVSFNREPSRRETKASQNYPQDQIKATWRECVPILCRVCAKWPFRLAWRPLEHVCYVGMSWCRNGGITSFCCPRSEAPTHTLNDDPILDGPFKWNTTAILKALSLHFLSTIVGCKMVIEGVCFLGIEGSCLCMPLWYLISQNCLPRCSNESLGSPFWANEVSKKLRN